MCNVYKYNQIIFATATASIATEEGDKFFVTLQA